MACLVSEPSDGIGAFRNAFFEPSPLSHIARRALGRYARKLDIPQEMIRVLFCLYWLDYAVAARRAELEGIRGDDVVREVLADVPVPGGEVAE